MIDLHVLEDIALVAAIAVVLRQAAGRLALRASIGPLLFLVSRWPFVVAWILGTGGWAWYLTTHVRPGASPMPTAGVVALSLLCGGGVAVMVVLPVWSGVRLLGPKPVLPLEAGEVLLWESMGNHFLGMESRGGRVLVTSRRLCFRPHRLNVQLDPWSLPLDDVDGVEVSGSRFLILRHQGVEDWLVVPGPVSLADGITALRPRTEAERVAFAREEGAVEVKTA